MAKIAIITDQHFGIRSDSESILNNQEKFYREIFFPKLEELNINTVLHLGDIFDRRKYVNYNTLQRAKSMFLDPLKERDINMLLTVGNHDVFYKTTNKLNSPESLLSDYDNIKIYTKASEVNIHDKLFLLIPWITKDNKEHSFNLINNSKAYVAAGHLEISGFEYYRGSMAKHGVSKEVFDKYNVVMSGHFHHKSSGSNIEYLGAPSEYIWADYDDPRGFHIFDTQTEELEFIENPFSIFKKVQYDDVENDYTDLLKKDDAFAEYEGCYVKVVVTNKENPQLLETIVKNIEKAGAADVVVVESYYNFDFDEEDDTIEDVEDTLVILDNISKTIQNEKYQSKVNVLLKELYHEATSRNSEVN